MEQRNLRIAVSKGSLFGDAVELLTEAGLDTTGLADPGRRLIISNPGVDFIIVRPTDAPVFVTYGGADCGICGKDTLVEAGLSVMELVDLKFGYCRFIVAEPEERRGLAEENYERLGVLRIATKYPNITRAFFEEKGVQVDVIKMHGNIELRRSWAWPTASSTSRRRARPCARTTCVSWTRSSRRLRASSPIPHPCAPTCACASWPRDSRS